MKIAIIMGSKSDLPTMENTIKVFKNFGVEYEVKVVSAHRTPEYMVEFARTAKQHGFSIIIAGAGGAAHLPGMVAALTTLPVIGIPVKSKSLNGMDSLLSIVQMPGGVPVATMSIGNSGARNAGLFAIRMIALQDEEVNKKLVKFIKTQKEGVLNETF